MNKRKVIKKWKTKKNQFGQCWKYLMECVICETQFDITGSYYENNGGYTCSNECKYKRHGSVLKERKRIPWIVGKTKDKYPQLKGHWNGKKFSDEHKQNLSKSHKGKSAYWNKGLKRTDEHKEKISKELKRKYANGEIKLNKSTFQKGRVPHNKDKKASNELKEKLSKIRKEKPNRYWLGKERVDMKREKHHGWKGGVSFGEYSVNWDNKAKEKIRERDKYTCQKCGKEEKDEYSGKLKSKLLTHHIDFDKTNNVDTNIVTLCRSCHGKVHKSKDKWVIY